MSWLKKLFGGGESAAAHLSSTVASVEQLQECTRSLKVFASPRTGKRLFVLQGKAAHGDGIDNVESDTIDSIPAKTILFIEARAKQILTDYPSLARRVVYQKSGPNGFLFSEGVRASLLDTLREAHRALAEAKPQAVAIVWYEDGLDYLGLLAAMKSAPGVAADTRA